MIYYIAIILTIFSNVFYQLFQKLIPEDINPMVSLVATYLTAAIACLIILPFYPAKEGLVSSLKKLNWTSFALGIAIIGLELGFLLAYRAGWKISLAAILSNTSVALILIPIGVLMFSEKISTTGLIGVVLCIGGLTLINYK